MFSRELPKRGPDPRIRAVIEPLFIQLFTDSIRLKALFVADFMNGKAGF